MPEVALTPELKAAVEQLPPVASIMRKLLAVLDDPNSDLEDISRLIRADTALTANVLRLANTPQFAHSGRVSSIEEAVQQTGVLEVSRIVSTLSAQQLGMQSMDNYKIAPQYLWKHTLAVAVSAELLAERFLANPSAAYVAGLLHTVGMVTFEIAASNRGIKNRKPSVPVKAWEKEHFQMTNDDAAGLVLQAWNFPEDIVRAVATRHQPPTAKTIGRLGGILYLASAMAERIPAGLPVEVGDFPVNNDILDEVGLQEDEFHDFALDAAQKVSRLQAAF